MNSKNLSASLTCTTSFPDLEDSLRLITPLILDDSPSLANPFHSLTCRIASSPRPTTSSPATAPTPKRFRQEWLQQQGEQVDRDRAALKTYEREETAARKVLADLNLPFDWVKAEVLQKEFLDYNAQFVLGQLGRFVKCRKVKNKGVITVRMEIKPLKLSHLVNYIDCFGANGSGLANYNDIPYAITKSAENYKYQAIDDFVNRLHVVSLPGYNNVTFIMNRISGLTSKVQNLKFYTDENEVTDFKSATKRNDPRDKSNTQRNPRRRNWEGGGYFKWDGRTTYPKSPPRESGEDEEDWSSWYKEEMVHGMEGVNEVEAGSNSSLPELEDCSEEDAGSNSSIPELEDCSEEDDGSNCSMQELEEFEYTSARGTINNCKIR
uniref:Uncharacterized protein n=1 Tax=Daphnia galeata TaxID=27404 RepID=A0A8J2R9R5_9CRUS|nr:unnamed protein product [Daphnia galeata]